MVLAPEARIHSARLEAVGGGKRGARVTGGADDGDAAADGVEGDRGGLAAEVERQHVHRTVHAVVDGGVERRQDVRVEALAAVHGREAHAVAPPRARAGRRRSPCRCRARTPTCRAPASPPPWTAYAYRARTCRGGTPSTRSARPRPPRSPSW
jgi:hypothetical protein